MYYSYLSSHGWDDRREILTYNTGNHYIEFERATTDSTIFTFIYHPNNDYYELPIAVRLREMRLGGLTYSIVVDEEFTTAESKTLPDAGTMIFRQGMRYNATFV
ncbi:MAG: hypothetical protein ACLU4N_08250 [Butyricimonas faecihominis]